MEPPIQRKKRLEVPGEVKHTGANGDAEPYMLLGQQEKFASNVRYKSRSKPVESACVKDIEEPVSTPMAPRDPHPAPRVIYDTGAPKPKISGAPPHVNGAPKTHKSVKETQANITHKEVDGGKFFSPPPAPKERPAKVPNVPQEENVPALKPPGPAPKVVYDTGAPRPKKSTLHPQPSKAERGGGPRKAERKDNIPRPKKESTKAKPEVKASKPQGKENVVPRDRRESRRGKMNEFVQTDLEKGIVDSGQEAGVNYALQYKKGVAPPRRKGPKRMSEYAMQFTWKDGMKSSPLLAAEQIVYKSNPSAPPFKHDSMKKYSEYATQFQSWANTVKSTPNLVQELKKDKVERASAEKMRSKSVEDLHLDRMPAAGVEPVTDPEDKRFVQETMNPQKLHFPHGKLKKYRSEYQSNYKEPTKFTYESGAWKGADPAHLVYRPESDSARSEAASSAPVQTWFKEVLELRDKANEYKRRARGTHFSHEHLAQLYAKQAELWDGESEAASVVSALALECNSGRSSAATCPSPSSSRPSKKEAWSGATTPLPSGSCTPATERTLTPEPRVATVADDDSEFETERERKDEGRIPPPVLRAARKVATKVVSRHHLDRTTPSTGGAILMSPLNIIRHRESDEDSIKAAKIKPTPGTKETRIEPTPGSVIAGQTQVRCTCGAEPSFPDSRDPENDFSNELYFEDNHFDPGTSGEEEHGKAGHVSKSEQLGKKDGQLPEAVQVKIDGKFRPNHPRDDSLFYLVSPNVKSDKEVTSRRWGEDGNTLSPGMPRKLILQEKHNEEIDETSKTGAGRAGSTALVPPTLKATTGKRNRSIQVEFSKNAMTQTSSGGHRSGAYPAEVSPGVAQGKTRDMVEFQQRLNELQRQIEQERPGSLSKAETKSCHKVFASPAHGMPTRDSHVLMDEDSRSDHTMPVAYVQHPKNPDPTLKLRTIREESSDTYKAKTPQRGITVDDIPKSAQVPDDAKSWSNLSIASSCSLASETLEKARSRRDEFWGKPGS